ncbi:MAG: SAM-dependent methyltransferase [Ignavibacteria bacterium]|nr:MAG: SAM-dependent methyltransferase [Ignavibacteria bacterium]
MGIMNKLFAQAGKPSGRFGRFIGRAMNSGHARLHRWGLSHVSIASDVVILDIGCGGGKAVQNMGGIAAGGKVFGIDHSDDMVQLSRKTNAVLIEAGRVEITRASVSSLPFPDDSFDLVTAFETFYFWPDMIVDLKEVHRVLKPGGTLLIVNAAYGHEKFAKRNARITRFGGFTLHTPEELHDVLTGAGYPDVIVHEAVQKNWIAVVAKKN